MNSRLLRSLPPKQVVKRTDRTYSAVTSMRVMLGLSRGRKRRRRTEAAKAPRARADHPMSERFPRRAHEVPTMFFVGWRLVCAAALVAGPWMLVSGIRYRQSHVAVEATVRIEERKAGRVDEPIAHLRYEVNGGICELILKPPNGPKERKKLDESFRPGSLVTIWYPIGDPLAADVEGDHGVLLGGITFTGVGVLFTVVGALAFVAEFYPNKFVRFG